MAQKEKYEYAIAIELATIFNQVENLWKWATRKPTIYEDSAIMRFSGDKSFATDIQPITWVSDVWKSSVSTCVELLGSDNLARVYAAYQNLTFLDTKLAQFRLVALVKLAPGTGNTSGHLKMLEAIFDDISLIHLKLIDDLENAFVSLLPDKQLKTFRMGCAFYGG